MKENFKILADKFSVLNVQDNKDFILFYNKNKNEIEGLKDFQTDEELYLAAVINHTYGRSLLYESKDYKNAERHLDIARSMILSYKNKFSITLKEDVWYVQTLRHLLIVSLDSKNYRKAKDMLKELKFIDGENTNEYSLEEKEISRIEKYRLLMLLAYCGMGLIVISIIYRFVLETSLGSVGRIGTIVALIGLVGGYFYKDSVKKHGT
ncbi:MAG TPA: hypothetical protein VEW65_05170 [Chryseolinea sp.]|nr:hypothetical protein [Chryseolinea sp.]